MQRSLSDGTAFFVVALRSQEKGTRTVLRYPLRDTSAAGDADREGGEHKSSSSPSSPQAEDVKDKDVDSTTDLLSPIIPMLFPTSSERSCMFTLAAKDYVFITHFVNAQPPEAGNIPDCFVFVLGLQKVEECDLWSHTIAEYKLLLQQFTFTCLRENLRCEFLNRELKCLRALRDKCDNWAEFNRQALLQSELAQEIQTLVDGINKPTAETVQVWVNGFILVEMALPRPRCLSFSGAGRPQGYPCISGGGLPKAMARLMLHDAFNFSESTISKFRRLHPKQNFFDTIEFFSKPQPLESYLDKMKFRGKRDAVLRAKSTDHLQWLLEHRVLKMVEPRYLLLATPHPIAPPPITLPSLSSLTAASSTFLRSQHPAVLFCDASLDSCPVAPAEGFSYPRRSSCRREPSAENLPHWGQACGVTSAYDDDRVDSRPPKALDVSDADWGRLLKLAKDQPHRTLLEAMCEQGLLDGRHAQCLP